MSKTAMITGAGGQDAAWLAKLLLSKGYRVCGTVRRHSVAETQDWRLKQLGIADQVETCYADLTDYGSIVDAVQRFEPDEIYHLASMSHVRVSFDKPVYTEQVNAGGTLHVLEAYRKFAPKAKFYFAASSEMFGRSVDPDGYQRLTTPFDPVSPYGAAKVFGYHLTRHYRRAYGLFAVNGILFNHTGPLRGSSFVEAKIVKTAVQIKRGLKDTLVLGNVDSKRDWGDSRDYVRAMWAMLRAQEPTDWLIASGTTRSVQCVCEMVFRMLGLDCCEYVERDKRYVRPEELPVLRGDAIKAKTFLGWEPMYSFQQTLREMVDHWEGVFDGKDMVQG
jgi:GDPmannose 4,6-dehydratase